MSPDRSQQFLQKLSQLPEPVDIFFGSQLSDELTRFLSNGHDVSPEAVTELIYDAVIADFNTEVIKQKIAGFFNNDPVRTEKMYEDFLGVILLPID